MKFTNILLSFACLISLSLAEDHYFKWNATYITGNPDGLAEVDDIISCNGQYPWPDITVNKGDRIIIELYNGLISANTSIHFHGLFQHNSNQMDGVPGLTQCQVPPGQTFIYNFTVPDQVGSFWYHSHSKGQYMDGMRGAFIINDPENPYKNNYTDEKIISLSEWYHNNITTLTSKFLNRYNPTGAEPIPQNLLFNGFMNGTIDVKPNTDYLFRIINVGGFVSQYFWIEDHSMTVIAVDGIYVEPNITDMIYITAAQRYDVLISTKNETDKNFAMMQRFDIDMLDIIPDDLLLNVTNNLQYNKDIDWPQQSYVDSLDDYLDDFWLTPLDNYEYLDDYDHQITIDVTMDNLGNGINYAFFNNITYVTPKIPALGTVLSAQSDEESLSADIYGSNTHTFVLQKDEIVEIVLNNNDTGKHPFHLHGHVFQVFERGPDYKDEPNPIPYNESAPYTPRETPSVRDTIYVRPQSHFVIRFKADNPGVWFFHCHIEWHIIQGLALTFVEDPVGIRANEQPLSETWKNTCNVLGGYVGNAANITSDFHNLSGENVQPKPLPAGFTAKGIVALVFSCIAGILGCIAIGIYGMADIPNIEERVVQGLNIDERQLLADLDNEIAGNEEGTGSSGRYSHDVQNTVNSSDDANIKTEYLEVDKEKK
jgi:iron transport multicopper oxidase